MEVPKFNTKYRVFWGLASLGGAIISGTYASMLTIFFTDYMGKIIKSKFNSNNFIIY